MTTARVLKLRISSPLEAGVSILDPQHSLPQNLTEALEYASKRLARKALHITLVVVRRDYQLPPTATTSANGQQYSSVPPTPTSPPPSAGGVGSLVSPSMSFRSPSSVAAGFRSLVRKGTNASLTSLYSTTSTGDGAPTSAVSSPMFFQHDGSGSSGMPSPRRFWPPTPGMTAAGSMPCTPMTPHTPGSIMSTMSSAMSSSVGRGPGAVTNTSGMAQPGGSGEQDEFGIRLIYTTPLSYKDDKTVRVILDKAARKFSPANSSRSPSPSPLLPPATTAAACGLNADLVHRSIVQNEVLFSSEGLTLLGLDRLYTFKAALACYARTAAAAVSDKTGAVSAQTRIEETVDELRRLVLSGGNGAGSPGTGYFGGGGIGRPRQVSRSDLHRSYDWIRVSPSALRAVERMYRRAYGGPGGKTGAFEPSPAEEEEMREREKEERDREQEEREREQEEREQEQEAREREEALMARRMVKIGTPPPGRATPVARIAATTPALTTSTTATIIIRPKPMSSPQPQQPQQPQQLPSSPRRLNAKAPKLTLQTATATTAIEIKIDKVAAASQPREDGHKNDKDNDDRDDDESDRGDRTARPFHGMPFWSNIDELLSPVDGGGGGGGGGNGNERRQSEKLGPMTPNGYDDISPITRGEWGFLFARDGTWDDKRTAPVETW
ncbi:pre-mRNA 3'-end-processing factor FIP1 [Microdochium nivale]|nr:pre-mRNA 3'-end-processing factor FIP1 [Microdochium nivale]